MNPVALVTGGSRGIGAATAIELGRRGFDVAVGYRTGAEPAAKIVEAVESFGRRAIALKCDLTIAEEITKLFRVLDDRMGSVTALICAAGVTRDTLLGASEPGDFETVLQVNFLGVVQCCREAARRMMAERKGAIVTVSSVAAQRPGRGQSNYAASKGAVESFTRALAVELASRNIRVNGVAPGVTETAMSETIRALAPEEVTKRILLRRIARPQEIAKVIAFLASEDASYVTGQVWSVDGGFKLE